MKVDIKVPAMGESVTEAVVGTFLATSGTAVSMGQEILELETDKVNQVVYAPQAGILTLQVQTGDIVRADQILGVIETEGQVQKEVQKQEIAPAAPVLKKGQTRTKMSLLRKTIAAKLVEVKNKTAMLTTFNEVDMTAILAARQKVKIGFMPFFIKACCAALEEYPLLNSFIEGEEIVTPEAVHMAIAVSTDKGLITPVIMQAASLSFSQVEQKVQELAQKARSGSIAISDLQGATFTITNGGVFGSLLSTPILNPPQSAILGMHAIQKRAVVCNDQIVIRPMMYLALSYDHRIVDGKEAILFLARCKEYLENSANFESLS